MINARQVQCLLDGGNMDPVRLRAQAAIYLKLAQEIKDRREAATALAIALDYFQRARDLEETGRKPVEPGGALAVRKSRS